MFAWQAQHLEIGHPLTSTGLLTIKGYLYNCCFDHLEYGSGLTRVDGFNDLRLTSVLAVNLIACHRV